MRSFFVIVLRRLKLRRVFAQHFSHRFKSKCSTGTASTTKMSTELSACCEGETRRDEILFIIIKNDERTNIYIKRSAFFRSSMKRRYKRARRNPNNQSDDFFQSILEKNRSFGKHDRASQKRNSCLRTLLVTLSLFSTETTPGRSLATTGTCPAKSQSPRFLLGLKPCSLPRPRRPLRGANENSNFTVSGGGPAFSPPLRHFSRRLRLACTSTASPVGPSSTGGIYRTTLGIFPRTFASILLLHRIARRWKSFDFEKKKKKNITQTTRQKSRRRRKTKSAGICGGSLA